MRAFLAILPDHDTCQQLQLIIEDLKILNEPTLHCTTFEKLHLTMHFFSNLEANAVDAILRATTPIVKKQLPFKIKITNKLLLPNEVHASVLAYAVELTSPLQEMKAALNEVCNALGYPDHYQHFLPHLTLARSKDADLLQQISLPELNIEFMTNELSLYESYPRPGNFAYQEIARITAGYLFIRFFFQPFFVATS